MTTRLFGAISTADSGLSWEDVDKKLSIGSSSPLMLSSGKVDSSGALNLNSATSTAINFQVNSSTKWSVTSSGVLESSGSQTIQASSGNLNLSAPAIVAMFPNTSDGSDNGQAVLQGGGAWGYTRGGSIAVYGNEHASSGNIWLNAGTTGVIDFYTNNTFKWRIASNGTLFGHSGATIEATNIALQSNSGTVNLVTNTGNINFNTAYTTRWTVQSGGALVPSSNNDAAATIGASGTRVYLYGGTVRYTTLTNDSDLTLKKNITEITSSYSESFSLLQFKKFNYLVESDTDRKHYGVIAQEAKQIIDDLVLGEEGSYGIDTNALTIIIGKVVQEILERLNRNNIT